MNFRLVIPGFIGLLIGGCSLPLVSEQEVALEADKEFANMRAQMAVSTDINVRRYVYCVAENIIDELEEPYASLDWEIEIFENEL